MKADAITQIEIDSLGRLLIYPEKEKFNLIWRSATEVHWDEKKMFLFSPKPREWSYFDWYGQIISVIRTEYACSLFLTENTIFINISPSLKQQILLFKL